MKQWTCIALAVILVMTLLGAAMADEAPQPEGGKKFDTDWAVQGILVQINYEEEGYRVFIATESRREGMGTEWFYSCYYHPEDDTLVSVSSSKQTYTFTPIAKEEEEYDLEKMGQEDERIYAPAEYDGFDDEGTETVFSIDEHGHLVWTDGHENMGADLEFSNIGRFLGDWKNDAEGVYVMIEWNLYRESRFDDVFIKREGADPESFTLFVMTGMYNEETGKLECVGSAWTRNSEGNMVTDGETYDAFFSLTDNGGLLFETANGIELEPDYGSDG